MTLINAAVRTLVSMILCATAACASAHSVDTDAGFPNDAAPRDATTSSDAASDAAVVRDAAVGLPDLGAPVSCVTDSDCNEDPAVSSLHGECIDGQCFCLEGSWMQASGRCGVTAPTCAAAGGTCRSSAEVGAWCLESDGEDLRPIASTANDDCVARGTGDVCCIAESACSSHPDFVDYCYVAGSDAAYVPPCTNGWLTCVPGDSPELRIGG